LDKFVIHGGCPLNGKLKPSGSKNSVLPIMAGALLCPEPVVLHKVPRLLDIGTMSQVMEVLGAKVEWTGEHSLRIDAGRLTSHEAPYDLVRRMRASINVMGPLLARLGRAKVSLPGGCAFGPRPVDLHIKGIQALGAEVRLEHGYILASTDKLMGGEIYLSGNAGPSRGACNNTIMTATLAEGLTVINGAAMEPELIQLQEFINSMGGKISGAGSNTIQIEGVKKLHGTEFEIMDDYIEAGTYLIAGAMAGGTIEVVGDFVSHLKPVLATLAESGAEMEIGEGGVVIRGNPYPEPVNVTTMPYPGFPTDMQAQMMAYLCRAKGSSVIRETIYPDRFNHAQELLRLGADIKREDATAIINGVESLSGAFVMASDLRASAALVLAGLVAGGETHIRRVYHIDRGYERIEDKLRSIGAEIQREED